MASSCAKSILLGEHAVVYGVPALAVGLPRGALATGVPSETALLRLGGEETNASAETDRARAFRAILESLHAPPCTVEVTLQVPAGVGLGASAAIGVAIARAVLEAHPQASVSAQRPSDAPPPSSTPELDRVVEAAMAWERVFHGNPSGVDVHAAAHGGCLRYVRGEGARVVHVGKAFQLALCVAGPAASTRVMVDGLARLRERKPAMVEKSFDGIRSLVDNAIACVDAGDDMGLGKLMDLNQMLLSGLFLSTPDIEDACALARKAGAYGAKLTGAGGGGCVVAVTRDDPGAVLAAWRAASLECFTTTVPASEAP